MAPLSYAQRARDALMRDGKSLKLSETPYVVVATLERWGDERRCEMEGWFHTYENGTIHVEGLTTYEQTSMVISLAAKLLASEPSELGSHRRCYGVRKLSQNRDWVVVAVAAATGVQAKRMVEHLLIALNL